MSTTTYVPLSRVDVAFVAALVLVGLDGVTTAFALQFLEGAVEANPVIAALINTVGVVPAVCIKMLLGAALATFLCYSAEFGYPLRFMQRNWRLKRVPRKHTVVRAYRMLVTLAVLHGLVVINNAIVIYTRS